MGGWDDWLVVYIIYIYFETQKISIKLTFLNKKIPGMNAVTSNFFPEVFFCVEGGSVHLTAILITWQKKKPPVHQRYVVFNQNLYPTRPVTLEPGQISEVNWMDQHFFQATKNHRKHRQILDRSTQPCHKVPAIHPDQQTVLARSKFLWGKLFLVGIRTAYWWFSAETDSKTYYTPVIQVEIRNSDHLAIQYYVDVYPPKKMFHSTFLLTPQRASRSFHQDRKLQPFDAAT